MNYTKRSGQSCYGEMCSNIFFDENNKVCIAAAAATFVALLLYYYYSSIPSLCVVWEYKHLFDAYDVSMCTYVVLY